MTPFVNIIHHFERLSTIFFIFLFIFSNKRHLCTLLCFLKMFFSYIIC
ncbi:hypothetical protein HMPREF9193_01324 [Treponema lecithinolyticum ATCC 700332]|uniref:Uncharacterized protein n=1 Tax=Treponema lecithinolyticum ATCC 700332 TaxID=1321815 RepID=A0ABN0NY79_TRELE|nr:hypothetical protein HMPREF9193_01324 [Treponema lecithinolyticum ATCC 700332]